MNRLIRIALWASLMVAAGVFYSKVFASSILESAVNEEKNQVIFERVYNAVKDKANLPMPELVTEIALQFLGTDYVASTLEQTPEQLHVYLDKTDCILFVEMCSCFALTVKGLRIVQALESDVYLVGVPYVKKAEPSYALLCDNIRNMRYRWGKVDGYASRIHYTSEWILQNRGNNILQEYTKTLGDEFEQKFYFMSTHPEHYKQLADTSELKKIVEIEQFLTSQAPYYYISQEKLQRAEIISQIQSGDIICFVSKQGNGIDIAHVAIAYEVDGEMHFIHASYGAKKVIIEPKTLAEYAVNGVRVCRFLPAPKECIAK